MSLENAIQITRLDPWMKRPIGQEDSGVAIYVGRYELPIGIIDTCTEALFLCGGPDGWKLWAVREGYYPGLDRLMERVAAHDPQCLSEGDCAWMVVAGTLQSGPREAAKALFKVLLRARFHHLMPRAPYRGGLLKEEDLDREVTELLAELENNHQAALAAEQDDPSPILDVARTFRLGPRPAGQNPQAWWANCPCGGQHSIMISTSSNEFGCGYCRRKGGPDELRRFCEDRGRKERKP